jgi:predicted porin
MTAWMLAAAWIAAAGQAMAQNNVAMYGMVDMGWSHARNGTGIGARAGINFFDAIV